MKKGYWIIFVFAIWCLVSALWYMFSVKGLPDNTGLIKPSTTSIAILEIIIMITVAFLLGFGLAWMMRSEPLELITDELRNSKYEIRELDRTITIQKETVTTWERNSQLAEEKAAKALSASNELNSKISELASREEELKRKNRDLETKVQILDGEVTSSKFRIRVLESELGDKNKAIGALTQELDEVGNQQPKIEHRDWSDHPFVRPVEISSAGDERDDLTEIKGIGPAFQKKLNALDIYTFRQLSELDGEAVERLAEVIEVFPDRIHRDNWIGQATKFYNRKIGRET
jgi:predicted flap endonuclease-1-like 5' DNA nuclease